MPAPLIGVAGQIAVALGGVGAAYVITHNPLVISWKKFVETLGLTPCRASYHRAVGVIDGFAVTATVKGHLDSGRSRQYYFTVHYPAIADDLHVRQTSAGPLSRFEFDRAATYSDGQVSEFDLRFVACANDPFTATSFFTRERRQALASLGPMLTYVSETEMTCTLESRGRPPKLQPLVDNIMSVASLLVGANPRIDPNIRANVGIPAAEPALDLGGKSPFSGTESGDHDLWVLVAEMMPGLELTDGVDGVSGWLADRWVSVERFEAAPNHGGLFRYRVGYPPVATNFTITKAPQDGSPRTEVDQHRRVRLTIGKPEFDAEFDVFTDDIHAMRTLLRREVRRALHDLSRYAWALDITPGEIAQTSAEVSAPWDVVHTLRLMMNTSHLLKKHN